MRTSFLLSILLIPFLLGAQKYHPQHSLQTLVYQLTDVQAEEIYKQGSYFDLKEQYLNNFRDSFPFNTKPNLPVGHYLLVSANKESIDFEMLSQNSISAKVLNNDRDLAIQVIDSLGQPITNAKVTLKKRTISFDQNTQSYRLKKWSRQGFLKIQTANETAYYEIRKYNREPLVLRKLGRFSNSKVGRWVSLPVRIPYRMGRWIFNYFYRGISYGQWRPYFNFRFRYRDKDFKGYMALNKPKYQPNDTLHLKAFVTNHKGKPINKGLALEIKEYYRKTIVDTFLQPDKKGHFEYSMILSDSLTLDKKYNIYFKHPSKDRKLGHSFFYEDYQLKEVDFILRKEKEIYSSKEKIILFAEGKDKNGLTIPDGEVQITLLRSSVQNYFDKEVIIPDTLWQHKQALAPRGETQILIPEAIFPKADLSVKAHILFFNSNGESHEEKTEFKVQRETGTLELKIENGEIIAEYLKDGKSTLKEAELLLFFNGITKTHLKDSKTVQLPYKEKFNPHVRQYTLKTDGKQKKLGIPSYGTLSETDVKAQTKRTKDSVFVNILNPNRLMIRYLIQKGNKEIIHTQSDESKISWRKEDQSNASYHLKYHFFYSGSILENEEEIRPYKNLLKVEINQKEAIIPGETIPIQIKVKDFKNRPAPNVNMVAGAINNQFEKPDHLALPDIIYKRKKSPFQYNNFSLNGWGKIERPIPVDKKWQKKLNLEKQLYYQLLLPEKGIHFHYDTIQLDTFYNEIAQFAPYLTKEGKFQPIYLIYRNRELVYFNETDNNPPYSFIGSPGYNQIVVRGKEWEYTIDSVWMEKGQKLEFSLDELNYQRSKFGKNVKRVPVSPKLSIQEKRLLKKNILFLKKIPSKVAYVSQGDLIQRVNSSWSNAPVMIGPFTASSSLTYHVPDQFKNVFKFEGGYSYEISESREKLYDYDYFNLEKEYSLRRHYSPSQPGQLIYSPSIFNPKTSFIDKINFQDNRDRKQEGKGTYVFKTPDLLSKDSTFLIQFWVDEEGNALAYKPNLRSIRNIPPGEYQVYLFTSRAYYIKQKVTIQANQLLFQQWEVLQFEKNKTLFEKYLLQTLKEKEKEDISMITGEKIIPSYPGGRLISGYITDETGEPLIGCSILAKGTSYGTVSDIDGYYEFEVPPGTTDIVISYTGFSDHQVNIQNQRAFDISLMESSEQLQEVVVTGLATRTIGALRGQVAGVTVDKVSSRSDQLTPRFFLGYGEEEDSEIFGERTNSSLFPNQTQIREDFADYAFWQPNLVTDENGEIHFNATFPDNITSWQTYAVGMDNNRRAGYTAANTRSFKKLMAQLAIPRFLIEGDQANLIGKSINYTNDTFNIQTSFEVDGKEVQTKNHQLKEVVIDELEITSPAPRDSLNLTYFLEMGHYLDGEKRSIPVLQKGTIETIGAYHLLEGDTSITFLPQAGKGNTTIEVLDNMLDVLIKDIEFLKNYPYACNEQTASRLIALLMEREVKKVLNQSFEHEKAIHKAIARLNKTQKDGGSWGWWQDSPSNHWMTIYVLKALHLANKQNYQTTAFEKGLRYITSELEALSDHTLLKALDLLSDLNQNIDYAYFLKKVDTDFKEIEDKLTYVKIQQAAELSFSLDTLFKHQKETSLGGLYWGEERLFFNYNVTQSSLLAYQIFKKAGRKDICKKIQQYFLQKGISKEAQKGAALGRNTFESAQIVSTILPDLLYKGSRLPKSNLQLSNGQSITSFPAKINLEESDLNQSLQIQKKGDGQVYLSIYQQFHNSQPEAKSDLFSIATSLIQNGEVVENSKLEKALPTKLKVVLDVKQSSEYVMIEVPIPAGCSYGEKLQFENFRESHREYFKEKTVIFCEDLPIGKYEFTIHLEPRFSGNYTLNLAKVEQMYFPMFYGRNEIGIVEIE